MNILSDEFRVSNYIKTEPSNTEYMQSVFAADEWCKDYDRYMVTPNNINPESNEDLWIKYNSMTKKQRRESDWKSIELFGTTNQDNYESNRKNYLGSDFDTDIEKIISGLDADTSIQEASISDGYIDDYESEMYHDGEQPIEYGSIEVEEAIKWAEDSNRVIIVPTRSLEELEASWEAFNSMLFKHRQWSDDKSISLFGLTNLKHYEYLKKQFLKEDISKEEVEKYASLVENHIINTDMTCYYKELVHTQPTSVAVKSIIEAVIPNKSFYEDRIISNIIDDALEDNDLICNNPEVNDFYGDLPCYTPDEMINMRNTLDLEYPEADNVMLDDVTSVSEWFECYKAAFNGFYTEFGVMNKSWVQKVRELSYGLKRLKESNASNDAIKSRMRSLYELGWNPDIDFENVKARRNQSWIMNERMNKLGRNTRVVDLRGFSAKKEIDAFTESEKKPIYPIYIVLTEGKTLFSAAIKGLTKSIYSHASIAFNAELTDMYSFAIDNKDASKSNGIKGGLRVEDLSYVPEGGRMHLYAFFVGKEPYDKIRNWVLNLNASSARTSYGYKNLISYLFKIPTHTSDYSMFCSQFVDRCLKLIDVDITGKDSVYVSPEDFNKAARNESRIYHIYQGLASSYKGSKTESLINSLIKKAIPLKEHAIYLRDERSYLAGISANMYDVNFLREMSYHLQNTVKDDHIKKFLQEVLFDKIEVRDYMEGYIKEDTHSDKPSIEFMTKAIRNIYPIV